MSEHRVATHLGVDPASYDRKIGRWVPGYEDMIATVVSILDDVLPADPLVIDLGAAPAHSRARSSPRFPARGSC